VAERRVDRTFRAHGVAAKVGLVDGCHTDDARRASASEEKAEARPRETESCGPSNNVALTKLLCPPIANPPPPHPPNPRGGGGGLSAVLAPPVLTTLQRTAGNGSVQALIGRVRRAAGVEHSRPTVTVQRADDVAVTGVTISASKVTIPLSSTLTARPQPANATGVTFSVEKGTVDPTSVTIDAAS
jgi:hypothetical protein